MLADTWRRLHAWWPAAADSRCHQHWSIVCCVGGHQCTLELLVAGGDLLMTISLRPTYWCLHYAISSSGLVLTATASWSCTMTLSPHYWTNRFLFRPRSVAVDTVQLVVRLRMPRTWSASWHWRVRPPSLLWRQSRRCSCMHCWCPTAPVLLCTCRLLVTCLLTCDTVWRSCHGSGTTRQTVFFRSAPYAVAEG